MANENRAWLARSRVCYVLVEGVIAVNCNVPPPGKPGRPPRSPTPSRTSPSSHNPVVSKRGLTEMIKVVTIGTRRRRAGGSKSSVVGEGRGAGCLW